MEIKGSLAFSTIIVNFYYNLHSISIHEFTRQSLWIFFLFHEVLKFNYLITWLWNKGYYIVSNILISLDLWNCMLRCYILLLTYTVPSYTFSHMVSPQLTLYLPLVTKRKFLLTISIQY